MISVIPETPSNDPPFRDSVPAGRVSEVGRLVGSVIEVDPAVVLGVSVVDGFSEEVRSVVIGTVKEVDSIVVEDSVLSVISVIIFCRVVLVGTGSVEELDSVVGLSVVVGSSVLVSSAILVCSDVEFVVIGPIVVGSVVATVVSLFDFVDSSSVVVSSNDALKARE